MIPDYDKLLEVHPPDNIPYNANLMGVDHFDDLVMNMRAHHKRNGRDVSAETIRSLLEAEGAKMGMGPAMARGVFGDIWSKVKQAGRNFGSNVLQKGKDFAEGEINKAVKDPLGTLESIGKVLGPLLTTAAVVA